MFGGRRWAVADAAASAGNGAAADAAPLLPVGLGGRYAPPSAATADPRFTLDDDDVFDDAHGGHDDARDGESPPSSASHASRVPRDQDVDIEAHPDSVPLLLEARSSFATDAEPSAAASASGSQHTYPPARGASSGEGSPGTKLRPLPPSYYDAMRPVEKTGFAASFAEFRRELREHMSGMPQYVPSWMREGAGALKYKARRLYAFLVPQSRIAHMSYLVAGLWLLVVFTGPVFEASSDPRSSDDPWDWAGAPLNHRPPLPYLGDGQVHKNASWAHKGCVTEADASSWSWFTWCHAITEFYLPLAGPDVSGQLYFLADPPPPLARVAGSHGRSLDRVPGARDDDGPAQVPPDPPASSAPPEAAERDDRGSVHGTLRMVEYVPDPSYPEVRRTAARVTIKAKFLMAAEEYFVASSVMHLTRNGGDQGIGIYTRPPPSPRASRDAHANANGASKRGSGHRSPLIFDVTVRVPKGSALRGVNITTSSMDVILFDTLTSVSPSWRRSNPLDLDPISSAPRDEEIPPAPVAPSKPYLESLLVSSGSGFVGIGGKLGRPLVIGDRLELASDQNTVALAAQIEAGKGLAFSSNQGDIRFLPNSKTVSPAAARLVSQKDIVVMSGAEVGAASIEASARAFSVHHHGKEPGVWRPLSSLRLTATHNVEAHLRVPETTQPVEVTASTAGGDMCLSVQDVAFGTPLHANVSGAHTEVSLGPTYVGQLFLRGPGPRPEDGQLRTHLDPLGAVVGTSPPSGKSKGKNVYVLPQPATQRVVDPAPASGPAWPAQAPLPPSPLDGAVDALVWRPPGPDEDPSHLASQTNGSYIIVAGHAEAHALFL